MQLPAGQVPGVSYPVPVVRIRFDERVFFDFDKDSIRPEAEAVLAIMAENMRHDVPDAQLTILGHTDAIGSDAYNFDLSSRRATNVMQALYQRGVRLSQMSTVAVGKTQPVAPNSTDEGRALNRRVEFMISASEAANLTLVSKRRVVCDYFATDATHRQSADCGGTKIPAQVQVAVQKPVMPTASAPAPANVRLATVGTVQLEKPKSEAEIRRIAPIPDVRIVKPADVHQAQLKREFDL